ncbi:F-box protein At5g39450-like isoform X1 [Helianthus annuus]|uniref:F-box protein At5g39450-like isoform X1 n=1 Tax=Helianthus annuus TaxID=4232 RepID=UPI0016530F71|nr:F-box protein At5g39450-like isoform X1 [Helianthus annuus]XP_035838598.1 F-box protein At5g39450-like isoform X1 [Helianthus annuus]
MLSDNNSCGSKLLLALPDDIFAVVTRSLKPKDVFNLSLCCRSLYVHAGSDKVWLTQCELLGVIPHKDLIEWRKGVNSYKALCRFLVYVQPLIGIWVHQNPELGNVVYVMPGFISLVGCRIIPQELGPLGIDEGPILWSPVFEILGNVDGSSAFIFHGRERGNNYMYPGSIKGIDRNCNVLLLEVEPRQQKDGGKLVHSKSFAGNPNPVDKEFSRKICPSDRGLSMSQRIQGSKPSVPFSRLAFVDRKKLLEVVTSQIRVKVSQSGDGLCFPCLETEDFNKLSERHVRLMQLYDNGLSADPTQSDLGEIRKLFDNSQLHRDAYRSQGSKKKSLVGYFRDSFKSIIGKSSLEHTKHSSSGGSNKHAQFQDFLRSGDTIGLTLHASTARLSSYRAWPNMHESRFALYKLAEQEPLTGQEHAGLWAGTFGWPPGKPSADKPGKALFFLLLSYVESQGERHLIGTKILEGTHYVLHPNGSAMFVVNINEPSDESFPWACDGDSDVLDLKEVFSGEGIANGYGFRYPGSKPGSLFVFEDGMLVFTWKESRAALTLQRVNLQDLLKKGERVPPLPPIANFAYLTKSYSNVYAGFSNALHPTSSPRGFFKEEGVEETSGVIATRKSVSGIRIGRI